MAWVAGAAVAGSGNGGATGIAIGASTVVFSAADSFVLRRLPYPNADRLIVLHREPGPGANDSLQREIVEAWRNHKDLFESVGAHQSRGTAYVTIGGIPETIRIHGVTPGVFEMLGVPAQWGRSLQPGDERADTDPVVVIGEDLARRFFGDPARAVGATLPAEGVAFHVVGVLPGNFRFPTSREQIWRALDLGSWPIDHGIRGLFLRNENISAADLATAVAGRWASVRVTATRPRSRHERGLAVRMISAAADQRARLIFLLLMSAAGGLLLIACANIASLGIAATVRDARTYAISTALGASRASLVRIGLMEGAAVTALSGLGGWITAEWTIGVLARSLPPSMSNPLTNPLDIDPRALTFGIGVAAGAWLLTSLPVVLAASRTNPLSLMRRDSAAAGRGGLSRRALLIGQVAMTIVLLVATLLVARTYAEQMSLEKGFDSRSLASVIVTPRASSRPDGDIEQAILDRLRSMPDVRAVSRTGAIPPSTQGGVTGQLSISGKPVTSEQFKLATYSVDPDYFQTAGIRLLAGRPFTASDPPSLVVVDEAFARRFWPDGDALGAQFAMGGYVKAGASRFEIVGVTAHIRADSAQTPEGNDLFIMYGKLTYNPLSFIVRLTDDERLPALASMVREEAPEAFVRVDTIDNRYANLYGDMRLTTAVTTTLGLIAFIVAVSGVYSVMSYIVAARTREIGVRLAIGARPSDIQRLILGGSARLILAGAALGLLAAVLGLRFIESLLFNVQSRDPATLAVVIAIVSSTALLATWLPARRAARIDPILTLRAE